MKAVDVVGGQHHAPAALPPGKTRYPLYRRLGGPQGRSGRVRKISPAPGFDPRSVRPVSQSVCLSLNEFTCCCAASHSVLLKLTASIVTLMVLLHTAALGATLATLQNVPMFVMLIFFGVSSSLALVCVTCRLFQHFAYFDDVTLTLMQFAVP